MFGAQGRAVDAELLREARAGIAGGRALERAEAANINRIVTDAGPVWSVADQRRRWDVENRQAWGVHGLRVALANSMGREGDEDAAWNTLAAPGVVRPHLVGGKLRGGAHAVRTAMRASHLTHPAPPLRRHELYGGVKGKTRSFDEWAHYVVENPDRRTVRSVGLRRDIAEGRRERARAYARLYKQAYKDYPRSDQGEERRNFMATQRAAWANPGRHAPARSSSRASSRRRPTPTPSEHGPTFQANPALLSQLLARSAELRAPLARRASPAADRTTYSPFLSAAPSNPRPLRIGSPSDFLA